MTAHVDDTAPYPWPYDGRIDGGTLALILAGWDRGWAARVQGAEEVSARCEALADAVIGIGGEVFAVAHLDADPLPVGGGRTVAAPALDGLYGSALDPRLRTAGRTHLLVAGHGLEGPVHSTLRSANDRGYECLLVTDACSSLALDLAEAAAKTVTMSGGIFGAVGTSAAVLAALGALAPPSPTDHQEP